VYRAKWEKVKERISNLPPTPTPPEKKPAPSTQRARLCRLRRSQGFRLARLLITQECLDSLISQGYLASDRRDDPEAIANSVSGYLFNSLVEPFQHTLHAKITRQQRQGKRFPDRPLRPKPSREPAPTDPQKSP
jgi:hypothetical protein